MNSIGIKTELSEDLVSGKSLPNYPDYLITSQGEIYSKYHKAKYRKLSCNRIKNNGYIIISIRDRGGIKRTLGLHQLVALAWLPNPYNKPCVGHKNNIRTDNRVENLYWCTFKENTQQCINDNRFYKPPKKASKREIEEIYQYWKQGLTWYRLSKIYKYSQRIIKQYCLEEDEKQKNKGSIR